MKQETAAKFITLRRDGKGPLKFNGIRIGDVTRSGTFENDEDENEVIETSGRLYKTTGGKFIAGVEFYNRTKEEYAGRYGWVASTLQELVKQMKEETDKWVVDPLLDHDIYADLFEGTEAADQFVELVD